MINQSGVGGRAKIIFILVISVSNQRQVAAGESVAGDCHDNHVIFHRIRTKYSAIVAGLVCIHWCRSVTRHH